MLRVKKGSYCYAANSGVLHSHFFSSVVLGRVLARAIPLAIGLVVLLFTTTPACAQEDAGSLAKRLETQLLANPALQMKFTLEGEGLVTVKADLTHKRIRIESPSMLVVCDGKMIWNLNKHSKHVTVDAVSEKSPMHDPASLFMFSENYTAKSEASQGYVYQIELTLTPKDRVKSLLKAAGDVRELVLNIRHDGQKLEIYSARATSARGPEQTTDLSITPLKKIRASDFNFKVTGNMKVLDLRE